MNTTTVDVDLAKNEFVACVADGVGRAIETREFNRVGFLAWLSSPLRGTLVGMEACGGAHRRGRTMQAQGLEPKNDRTDAAAACRIVAASPTGCCSDTPRPSPHPSCTAQRVP